MAELQSTVVKGRLSVIGQSNVTGDLVVGGVGYLANSGTDPSCIARMADITSLKTDITNTLANYLDKRSTAETQTVAAASTFTNRLKSKMAPSEDTDVVNKAYADEAATIIDLTGGL